MNTESIEIDREERHVEQVDKDGKRNVPENSTESGASTHHHDVNTKPYIGLEFESEEAARSFYDTYAKHVGFNTHVGQYARTKPDGPIVSWDFACSREVFRRKNVESCNSMLRIENNKSENWVVTKFVEDHNHSMDNPSKVQCIKPRRHFAGGTKNVDNNQNELIHENNIIPTPPLHFVQPYTRKRSLGKDAQNLLNYFQKMQAESPGFYYAIQLDNENRMTNVFWADARSRAAYSYYGDAVTFDTMYRPNQFQVPFAPFTGLNHHGQLVLFGCALLLDESESSFTWLFKTWLSSMNNIPPVSITTDQDRAIKSAINQVLPETRHCICKWHILREGQERLAHIYQANPSFYGDLYTCINFSETIEDFESTWVTLLDRYNCRKNEWLQAVYNARKQWAPVYFRDTFFAVLSSNHGVGSFFDGYVNQQTTLPMFFKQYERALENSLEREIEADYDTICTFPPLKTPSPIEQLAANFYTKKVFAKFQEELVETFVYTANKIEGDDLESRFRVAKYENDHKAYIVNFNRPEMKVNCSCQMFEYSGILCRHIFTVFTVTNVLTLPSHYILNRWTRNARSGLGLDEQYINVDSLASRFSNLCRKSLKYSEEGAISAETYTIAMNILKEGSKKLAEVKKNVAKDKPFTLQSSDESNKKSVDITTLWPWQEVGPGPGPGSGPGPNPNRFNLNEADLNQPTMAHVPINRDGSLADNTVVLTCFKSMTWVLENKNSGSKVAVINLKLQDYSKSPGETEVQFKLTKVTLEPMLKSMAYISQQLVAPANKVAVINLKLQDTMTASGETEVKFQVSKETLGSMLRSMAYIREQL